MVRLACGAVARRHGARAEIVQHEKADRRGQIALLAVAVDLADQFGQRHVAQARDFLHAVPERLFEADTGLVAGDHDRAFDDRRLHDASPPSMRCWSSRSLARSLRCSSRARSDLVRPNRARLASACLGRLFSLVALLESLQVDHVPHARLHHPATRRQDDSLARKTSLRGAQANLMVIQKSPCNVL